VDRMIVALLPSRSAFRVRTGWLALIAGLWAPLSARAEPPDTAPGTAAPPDTVAPANTAPANMAAPADTAAPAGTAAPVAEAAPASTAPPASTTAPAGTGAAAAAVEADPKRPITQILDEEFRADTETRHQPSYRVLKDRIEKVLQDFVEFGGYFRSGYGRADKGGPMVAFQAPGAATKYRLGNEAETYGELILSKNFYLAGLFGLDKEGERSRAELKGPIARVQLRMSFFNPYSEFASASATSVGLPEAWASVGNVLPFARSVKFWAGNRFYRRHDIHVTDFFYWNMSGGGGGVEDIPIGPGKLAFAWIGWGSTSGLTYLPQPDPENKAGFSKQTYELRAYDLPLLFGHVEAGISVSHTKSGLDELGNQGPKSYGFGAALVHTVPRFISDDGVQKLSLQFGSGPARTFTAGFETVTLPEGTFVRTDPKGAWRVRITESFSANIGQYFSLGPVLVFQLTQEDSPKTKQAWISGGVRPIVHFTRYLNIAVEGGVDWVKDEALGTNGVLGKITAAPQVSIDNRWNSRPVIRAFVTGAFWSDDFKGSVGGTNYATVKQGLSAGMQMEAWW
jgi:maltoporin